MQLLPLPFEVTARPQLKTLIHFDFKGDRWDVVRADTREEEEHFDAPVRIRRNGRPVRDVRCEDWAGAARLLRWPFAGPFFAIRFYSGAGLGVGTQFFTIRNRQPVLVVKTEGEVGGPEFWFKSPARMVFDNYDYYNHWDKGGSPSEFLVYAIQKNGQAKLIRAIPDPKNRRIHDYVEEGRP